MRFPGGAGSSVRERGLSSAEATRLLGEHGPNELRRSGGLRWPGQLARQIVHPLAVLLWVASGLAWIAGTPVLAAAIAAVVIVNAAFAFVQERQAERAIEALSEYLPDRAEVIRDGVRVMVDVREIVPGDLLVVTEGERIPADAHLVEGAVEVDMSALTGESVAVSRRAGSSSGDTFALEAFDLLFSGTTCTAGDGRAVVLATGMQTQLGRIATLSQRVHTDESPLEHEVRHVAWVIAAVALGVGVAFLALGALVAGLPFGDAAAFAIGLLVANVPEGLLPTITLALAVGVRALAKEGALVKRLSAVETLGSTTVICTDKTGTLTENRMHVSDVWTAGAAGPLEELSGRATLEVSAIADALAACNNAELDGPGDPTELALVRAAKELGAEVDPAARARLRLSLFAFDPALKLMTTVDRIGTGVWARTKGAPEEVIARSTQLLGSAGKAGPLSDAEREQIRLQVDAYATRGLRVLAVARRSLAGVPTVRADAERELVLLGLVALVDPPRVDVPAAVRRCHDAGIRILVVTGDHALTAAEIARRVGIGGEAPAVITGDRLAELTDAELGLLLRRHEEIVFARTSPEAKLRIASALRAQGEVVAMTGDGVNDAPALRRADIGVAMGKSGTDVAREAATMILTDDRFATIVTAIEGGRRVYANVRKFIFYIFVHATPEVLPFLVFALSGGLVPLGLTVLQILAIDLGTETLPALALGREAAEPGIMQRPPRRRTSGVIDRAMLVRAWLVTGSVSALLTTGAFLFVLLHAGWRPGDETGSGSPLHQAYLEATTITFLGIVLCQVGTAFAARMERGSIRSVGLWSNRLLLWGVLFELVFAAALAYASPLQAAFGTAAPPTLAVALLLPFPFVVWAVDDFWRRRIHP
ncbi:MAG: cation-translocating P-type ATPase [Gaiellaceae bacterium]